MKSSTFKNWRFTTDMMMCDYILSEDHEHSMARSELKVIQSAINRLMQKLKGEGNIEAWVQSKITKAADYIDTAADYLDSQDNKIEEQNQGPSSPVKSYHPPEDNPGAPIIIGPNRGAAGIKYPVRYKTPLATNTSKKSKVQMASYEPEGEQIDEILGTGTVLAPSTDSKTGQTSMQTKQKFLGMNVPLQDKFKDLTPTAADTAKYNANPNRPTTINRTVSSLTGLPSATSTPRTPPVKPTVTPPLDKKPTYAELGRQTRTNMDNRTQATNRALDTLRNSYEQEGEQIDEFLGTGRVVAGQSRTGQFGSRETRVGTVQKVLGVKVPGSFQTEILPSDPKVYQSDVKRHNQKASPNAQIKPSNLSSDQRNYYKDVDSKTQMTYGINPDPSPKPRPSFFKKPVPTVTSTPTPTATPTPKPTTASGAMQQALRGVPLLGDVADIAKKYDDKSNYRNLRNQMGLQNSYDFESEVFVEEKKNNCNEEGLRDWFGKSKSKDGKSGWVNVVTGGTCASDEPGEGTPKCVSSTKRASMTDAERKSAARRKKLADPYQQKKSGGAEPTRVATDVKEESDKKGKGSGTKDACYTKVKSRYSVWPSAYASGALVKCRKVGAANWGTKSESTDSLDGDWHTPIRERADRYCPKCEKLERRSECKYGSRYWDMFSLPAEIISTKKDYNITMPYPANEETNIDENYLRIQSRGSTYTILINWRGKYITTQMFFQQFTRPTKTEVTREIRKVYPNAIVLAFNPSANDPTKPLLFTGEPNGPKKY